MSFLKRHERKLFFVAFIAGFVWDWLTVKLIGLKESSILLGIYLAIIAISIIIHNRLLSKQKLGFFGSKIATLLPYVIQFLFGTLFNAAFIFYSESADLYSNWPFILFLIALPFINEIFRQNHNALAFQMTMLFLASFLYSVFSLPIFLGEMSTKVFLLGGTIGLIFILFIMLVLSKVSRERFLHKHKLLVSGILLLYALFNYLYFTNIIPPIPLALKNAGIYHSLQKIGNDYHVTYEPSTDFWSKEKRTIHLIENEPVYVFSSVFAPAKVSVPIVHEWWKFDENRKEWFLNEKIEFPIIGGRKDGYRGYSFTNNPEPGKWRVYISTSHNRRLGHISFEVKRVYQKPKLESGKI
jgi:cell shape-determining protein MreD